ncbi:MAG: response regulator, partial [Gammaproteobacteria bacterium]|nr:response regulator [Gammaproteobacteria bacterium]
MNMTVNPKEANILVVDDEFANVLLLKKILEAKGYVNVVTTQDPRQALPLYQQHNSDIILLDLNMPELDGYGVMDQLNSLGQDHLPPILI